jgi:regulatory protein
MELKGAAGETVRVHLSDGSLFLLHAEVCAREGVRAGEAMGADRLAQLLQSSELIFARSRALSLLSRAAHTRKGLAQKLQARGFSAEAVRSAVERMRELGYLDDKAFADGWVRSRIATRKDGWMAIYRGLLGKGVARAIAEEVVETHCPFEVEEERARALVEGLSVATAIQRLKARGFRSRTIGRVVNEMKSARTTAKDTDREAVEE